MSKHFHDHLWLGLRATGRPTGTLDQARIGIDAELDSISIERPAAAAFSLADPVRESVTAAPIPPADFIITGVEPEAGLVGMLGSYSGAAKICGLDLLAASTPIEDPGFTKLVEVAGGDPRLLSKTVKRYLEGRQSGYVRAALPADDDAVGLAFADQAVALLEARTGWSTQRLKEVLGACDEPGRAVVALSPLPADTARLVPAVADLGAPTLIRCDGDAADILSTIAGARASARVGAILTVPGDEIETAEQLADAFDLIQGSGTDRIAIETSHEWLAAHGEAIARARHRLRGRDGDFSTERRRRSEMLAA